MTLNLYQRAVRAEIACLAGTDFEPINFDQLSEVCYNQRIRPVDAAARIIARTDRARVAHENDRFTHP